MRSLTLTAAIAAGALASVAAPANADDAPVLGLYLIRQYPIGKQNVQQMRGQWPANYTATNAMALKPGGVYEVYWYPSMELRSRGTYTFDRATSTFRWLSGLNRDMGRGGTFIPDDGSCKACIQLRIGTVAFPK